MTVGPEGPAPLPRRIVLTGFMGAGKSTVGPLLASRLGCRFLDIDTLITARHGVSVAGIFTRHGESHFRRLEAETIAGVLAHDGRIDDHAVIALGGGAVETETVRELLFPRLHEESLAAGAIAPSSVPDTVTIYLEAPLAELLARCQGGSDAPVRPLLAGAEPPVDRLMRRMPHYRRAHLTVDTSGASPATVVDRILNWFTATMQSQTTIHGTDTAEEPSTTLKPSTNGAAR